MQKLHVLVCCYNSHSFDFSTFLHIELFVKGMANLNIKMVIISEAGFILSEQDMPQPCCFCKIGDFPSYFFNNSKNLHKGTLTDTNFLFLSFGLAIRSFSRWLKIKVLLCECVLY